ncbi:MAG: membrane protein insertase YidC [Lachnospiraceae bacterium]|nr:membrane protein insertase YidC [Lachnospiraceae bacterium]
MLFLTAHGGILGPIATIFGYLMNGIYLALDKIGIGNIGLAIIIFTLITRLILYPFTVRQQKSSKLMAIIQPEIQAIQAKYQGKNDQQSMMAQQAEIKAVYEKYGTSMTGSCVQLLIQMPILFALYRVIMNVPAYVPAIKDKFMVIVNAMGGVGAIDTLTKFFNDNKDSIKSITLNQIHNFGTEGTYTVEQQKNFIIDFLYKLNPDQMQALAREFPANAQQTIENTMVEINEANSFLGLNLSTAPSAHGFMSPYILVPILAGLSQYASVMIMQAQTRPKTETNGEGDTMQQTMKSMNIMMPIMSAVFCWGFATGLGIYWIATSVFMVITQLIVNKQLKNLDIDAMIKQNIEKANKKRAKKGLPPINEAQAANNIKRMEEKAEKKGQEREKILNEQKEHIEKANEYYFKDENPDSLFAKANMVQKYNERNNK